MLQGILGISFLTNPSDEFESNMWITCILVDSVVADFTREDLRLAMEAANIETRPLWKPMHMQPVFEEAPFYGHNDSSCFTSFNKDSYSGDMGPLFRSIGYQLQFLHSYGKFA